MSSRVLDSAGAAQVIGREDARRDDPPPLVIRARPGWRGVDVRELWAYRDLFQFLAWRHIRARYAQSALGVGWAIVQPLTSMLIFTVVFGKLARVESDGGPYALFSFAALVPWTYFGNAVTDGAGSLVGNTSLLTKVYFPRLILPLSAVVAKLVDFTIALGVLFLLTAVFRVAPNWNVLWLPALTGLMVVAAVGLSTWLTALAIQYRDVKHATAFLVHLLMYASPVIYSTNAIPEEFAAGGVTVNPRLLYALNPMVGVIEGFRAAVLGDRPMPWDYLAVGTVSAFLIAATGCVYFRSRERLFADVA